MIRLFFLLVLLTMSNFSYAEKLPVLERAENVRVTPSIISGKYPKDAPILLITCSDYRFQDEVMDFMEKRGALDKYDHLIIAGSSLGIDNVLYPEFKKAFMSQLKLLRKMHEIKMVILLDHRDCNMYKHVHAEKHTHDKDSERSLHRYHMNNVKQAILSEYPDMVVEMLLMDTDGSVETIK
ncbi:MAG: hypothetical protein KA998_03830 [Rickettsiaceae bacterium]|nr:hypothetical protein [Rickettsiaceae bacterium]